ncbi:Maf-like protein [Thiomicrorhabdus immobilis]|uniref:7-methyl-GTP pyrophosphatase n=1 Tax=Thiomicrorhabdus immobilis TaxID=2791037 RepID=A0ABN6CVP8_9GAMM|nr:nucleoside triphosphate pyrophosphatase [Thiomicrorhabdus immobilis]BCN93050.1 Maf-like protein [Thiomicrorhabdus immobilis]
MTTAQTINRLPPIVLGSTSPFRKNLLDKLHLNFIQDAPDIDETPFKDEMPAEMVLRLANAKAEVFKEKYPAHIIITSDQCAVFDNQPIGKPHTFENAVNQLKQFSNQAITFYTGLVVLNTSSGKHYQYLDTTKVFFRELSNDVIHNYLTIEEPFNCAGSFKSEDLGVTLFNKIESRDPNALIGLPLMALTDIFYEMGYALPILNN